MITRYDWTGGGDPFESEIGWLCLYEDVKNLESQNAKLVEALEIVAPIMDNLLYWDTCPDEYKNEIAKFQALAEVQGG